MCGLGNFVAVGSLFEMGWSARSARTRRSSLSSKVRRVQTCKFFGYFLGPRVLDID